MSRKRKYIPLPEKLAAALACLLPQEARDDLRSRKVPASEVLSLFNFDHIVLFSIGGSDDWWNISPILVAPHREKSKRDIAIVAKAKRIDKKWSDIAPAPTPSKWPKRKMQSRGFG